MRNYLLINISKEHPQQGTESTRCEFEGENGLTGSLKLPKLYQEENKGFKRKTEMNFVNVSKTKATFGVGINRNSCLMKQELIDTLFGCGLSSEICSCPFF